jgi:MFS superfamily sulfate permease-like transporter
VFKTRPLWLDRLFPFLSWFPMSRDSLRADVLAGAAVALILVPQNMAYAQLAGLPVCPTSCSSWQAASTT